MPDKLATVLFCMLMTISFGCSEGPKRLHPPSIDVTQAGIDAIQFFDTDYDGVIKDAELSKYHALSMNRLDKDDNGEISVDEISFRITAWQDSKVGMMAYNINVKIAGQTLQDATVTLEPMKFLGDSVFLAQGVSDENGLVVLSVEESKRPTPTVLAVHCGFYRMRVSKTKDGVETIPSKYNTESELGIEIAPDVRSGSQTFDLSS